MKKALYAMLVLFIPLSAGAQAFYAGSSWASTYFLVDSQVGSAAGLGYQVPYTEFGAQIEHSVTRRFEVQARFSYSPTHKEITGNGQTLDVGATGIFWTPQLGFTMNVRHASLWTSEFDEQRWVYAPGVVTRFVWFGAGQRLYLDYVIPSGGLDVSTGIESNRLNGPEILWEVLLTNHIRMLSQVGVYHYLNQGNPFCDGSLGRPVTCPRSGGWAVTPSVGIRLEWPGLNAQRAW